MQNILVPILPLVAMSQKNKHRCKTVSVNVWVKTAFLAMTSHNFVCKIIFVTKFVIVHCCIVYRSTFDEQPGYSWPWEFVLLQAVFTCMGWLLLLDSELQTALKWTSLCCAGPIKRMCLSARGVLQPHALLHQSTEQRELCHLMGYHRALDDSLAVCFDHIC